MGILKLRDRICRWLKTNPNPKTDIVILKPRGMPEATLLPHAPWATKPVLEKTLSPWEGVRSA